MSVPSRTSKVLALSLGNSLTMLVSIASGMVAARVLTIHDLATMRQTMLAYQFAAPLLTLALPEVLYYFLPGSAEKKKGLLIDNLTLLFIMGGVFSLFLLSGGNGLLAWRFSNPDLEQTLLWLVPFPLAALPASLLGAVLVVQNRLNTLTIYNVLSRLLLAVAIIAACLYTRSYTGPVLVQVFFAIAALPVVLWIAFASVPGRPRWPRIASFNSMLRYSVPMGLATMLGTLTLQLDKLIVSSMCPPEQFAVYANGAIEIPLIGIVTGSIATVILADMTASCKRGDHGAALALFQKAAVRSGLILLPAMVFLFVFAEDFIVVLYSERYLDSVAPFRVYLLALPIRIVYYGSALMALNMTRVILWRSIGDLLTNAFLSVFFVYFMGYIGAALATVVTLYLWTAPFNIRKIAGGFGVNAGLVLPLKGIFRTALAAVGAVTLTAPLLWWDSGHLPRVLVAGVVFLVAYGLLIYRYISDFRDISIYFLSQNSEGR